MIAAITLSVPASIFLACGSSTFSADDADGATVTPQNDASNSDAPSTSDAGDGSTLPPTWCQTNAPNAFFCADFDEGDFTKAYYSGHLQTAFTTILIQDAGTPGLVIGEGDAGLSPTGTLSAIIPTLNGGGITEGAQAQTTQTNAANATGFQLDFDLRNDASGVIASGGTTVGFLLFDKTDGVTAANFEVDLSESNTFFAKNGTQSNIAAYPTFQVWTHYRMNIQLTGNVTIDINDGGVFDGGLTGTKISTTEVTLTLGHVCAALSFPACGEGVSFDNVVIHALGTVDGG